jgi:hypothetical protein
MKKLEVMVADCQTFVRRNVDAAAGEGPEFPVLDGGGPAAGCVDDDLGDGDLVGEDEFVLDLEELREGLP